MSLYWIKCTAIFVALASTPSAFSSHLSAGSTAPFSFTGEGGKTYEIRARLTGNACEANLSGACCALMVNDSNTSPRYSNANFDFISAPGEDQFARIIIEKAVTGPISVGIYAFSSCTYDAPTISIGADSDSIQAVGSGNSQSRNDQGQPIAINDLAVIRVDGTGDFALRDETRQNKGSNSGSMNDGDAIFTESITGYLSSHRFYITEPSRDADNIWDTPIQEELSDAHTHSGIVYDFWKDILGINSFDNNGADMFAQVNAFYPPVTTNFCGYAVPPGQLFNAFWNGRNIVFTQRNMTDFFDGEEKTISYAAALDVSAHEWGHAISDRTINLKYERESGALNEAFSDWIGVATEIYAGENNWTMGEGVETIRDLSNPMLLSQPDTYQGDLWRATDTSNCPNPDICENDYCGVHINSGVANKMFYLLVEGGTHNGIQVEGIGYERAIQIAYDALTQYWTTNETFLGARLGMEEAAKGYGSQAETSVREAWKAVGVLTSSEAGGSSGGSSGSNNAPGSGGGCTIGTPSNGNHALLLLLAILIAWRIRKRLI